MKSLVFFPFLFAASSFAADSVPIKVSSSELGDQMTMKRKIESVTDSYANDIRVIRDGLQAELKSADSDLQAVIKFPLGTLNDIVERKDVSGISALLPFVDWLHANQDYSVAGVLGDRAAQGTLNYFIDGIFNAEMLGAPDAVDEHKMEAMLRFYAGNPAQTSEGSWQANNTMLFVFGDRVVDCLATKVPDRVAAFYQAVLDARKIARLGPGPDEEAFSEDELPTAEQLRNYEAAFSSLEMLATKGVLPKSDPSVGSKTASPHVPTHKPEPFTPADESLLPIRWPVVAVVFLAVLGLVWVWLKKQK